MRSAVPSLSSVKESMSAIGLQPVLYYYTEVSWCVREGRGGEVRGATYLADELDLIALNILDCQNPKFGQEMQTQIIHRIPQDTLLNE